MLRRIILLLTLLTVSFLPIIAQEDDPLPLYALPDSFSNPAFMSGSSVVTQAGRLILTNTFNDTVSIIEPWNSTVTAEIPVGDEPMAVTITRDSAFALVVSRDSGTLTIIDIVELTTTNEFVVGDQPFAVVTDNNRTAYISLQGSHEVVEIDLTTGEILQQIPTDDYPAGMALWGDFLYVTHLWSGQISLIYLPEAKVVRVIETGTQSSLTSNILIEAQEGIAYVPGSISNMQVGQLPADNAILPVVNIIDLETMSVIRSARIGLHIADRPVNMPFAISLDRTRRNLYVANAGSDDISVIDLDTGLAAANIAVGSNPRSVVFSRDNNFVYVHNMLDGTLSIVDPAWLSVSDTLPISQQSLPVDVQLGAELFHTSNDSRLSQSPMISCASCHFAGESDGRIWLQPTESIGITTAEWLNEHIQTVQGGSGLADNSIEMDALLEWLRFSSMGQVID